MRQLNRLTSCVCLLACAALAQAADASLFGTTSPPPIGRRKRCPSAMGASARWCLAASTSSACRSPRNRCGPAGPAPKAATTTACRRSRRPTLMAAIGKQLLDGATLKPEDVAKQLGRKMHNYGDYQSFGDLIIESAGGEGAVTDYRRELDLDRGHGAREVQAGRRRLSPRLLRFVSRTRCWSRAGSAPARRSCACASRCPTIAAPRRASIAASTARGSPFPGA